MSGIFPSLTGLAALLPALDGVDRRVLVELPAALHAAARARGDASGIASERAPPEAAAPTDASSPLDARAAEIAALAERIRRATAGRVEPRNVIGYWDVAAHYALLRESHDFVLRLTSRGRRAASCVAHADASAHVRTPADTSADTSADADTRAVASSEAHQPHPAPWLTDRTLRWVAGREGLTFLLDAVHAGATTLAALLPGWRAVLAGNPRFAAAPSHARSLGQRVSALVRDGLLRAHGEHAARLADEAGFRGREPEPAFADLGGGLLPRERL